MHRFQHLYALLTYTLSTLNWVFWKDFDYFTRRTLGPYTDRKHPAGEIAQLIGFKVFFLLWSIVVPLSSACKYNSFAFISAAPPKSIFRRNRLFSPSFPTACAPILSA